MSLRRCLGHPVPQSRPWWPFLASSQAIPDPCPGGDKTSPRPPAPRVCFPLPQLSGRGRLLRASHLLQTCYSPPSAVRNTETAGADGENWRHFKRKEKKDDNLQRILSSIQGHNCQSAKQKRALASQRWLAGSLVILPGALSHMRPPKNPILKLSPPSPMLELPA